MAIAEQKLRGGVKFCPNCGTPVGVPTGNTNQNLISNPSASAKGKPSGSGVRYAKITPSAGRKKKRTGIRAVYGTLIGVLVLVCICPILYFLGWGFSAIRDKHDDSYKEITEDFVEALELRSGDEMLYLFPGELIDYWESEYDYDDESLGKYLINAMGGDVYSLYRESEWDDVTLNYEITKVEHNQASEKLKGSMKCRELADKVKASKRVEIDVTARKVGEEEKFGGSIILVMIKVDGDWYLMTGGGLPAGF